MKEILKIYNYPSASKVVYSKTKLDYEYETIEILDQKFKLLSTDEILRTIIRKENSIKRIKKENETKSFGRLNQRKYHSEIKSSQKIEGISEDTVGKVKAKEMISYTEKVDEYLKNIKKLDADSISKAYYIISNDEKFVDKDNENLNHKSKFRKIDITIAKTNGSNPAKIEKYINELNEWFYNRIDKIIKEEAPRGQRTIETFVSIVCYHYIFEKIHPLPDFNGRLGRSIYYKLIKDFVPVDEYTDELDDVFTHELFFLSKGIDAHRDYYYKAFKSVEITNDLSYFVLYYYFLLQEEGTYINFSYNFSELIFELSKRQEEILHNLFFYKNEEFSEKEYRHHFRDGRSKQMVIRDFNVLKENNFVIFKEYKKGLRRWKLNLDFIDKITKIEDLD